MAKERAILRAKKQFDEMIRQEATEGWMINEVEGDIWKRLLKIGRLTLQGNVDLQGTGDLGATFEYEGQRFNRMDGCYPRWYVSVFGKVTISRTVYGTPRTQKHQLVLLDARLGLPDREFSNMLQDWDAFQQYRI